jgi:hypothetical protein
VRVYDVAFSGSEVFRPTPNGVGSTPRPPHAEESEADSGPAAWLNSSLLGRCGFWLRRLPLRPHDPRPAGAGEPDIPAFPSTIQFPASLVLAYNGHQCGKSFRHEAGRLSQR